MDNDALHILTNRYVLFGCEGTAEGIIIQQLYDDDLMVVPRNRVVKDAVMVNRPYTRTRKAADIAERYFSMDYEVDGAEGLAVARIVDSRAARFEFPKRRQNGAVVLSFFTRPEIEMLIVHGENAYGAWLRESRRNRQLRPAEFCKSALGMGDVKETAFLREYWSDSDRLVDAIRSYAAKAKRSAGELLLVDLLK